MAGRVSAGYPAVASVTLPRARAAALPRRYTPETSGSGGGYVELNADGLPTLRSASPIPFDGPGDRWSPETRLAAAVGDCLILTFRAVARASGFAWTSLECDVTGTLDRIDRTTRFVAVDVRARLHVPRGTNPDRARQVLEKAEAIHLIPTIDVASEPIGELTTVDAMK
jgi:organic hydroperoxide reductase OsmC/OhrA